MEGWGFDFTTQFWAISKSIYAKAGRMSKQVTEENGDDITAGVLIGVNSSTRNESESKASPEVSRKRENDVCTIATKTSLPGKNQGVPSLEV